MLHVLCLDSRCQLFLETAMAKPMRSHLATCPYLSATVRLEKVCAAPLEQAHLERTASLPSGQDVGFFFCFFIISIRLWLVCTLFGVFHGLCWTPGLARCPGGPPWQALAELPLDLL